ncbi:hypothetical protein [Schleiferilactobacillus shenzhenensis]|nr:hypothetical protein [Schleiferilactobacillus shenzhenensis]
MMWIDFLLITLRFCALGVAATLVGLVWLLVEKRGKRARYDLISSLTLLIVAYAWFYFALPEPSLATTIMANLVSFVIACLLQAIFLGVMNTTEFTKLVSGGKPNGAQRVVVGESRPSKLFARGIGWGIGLGVIAMLVFSVMNVVDAKRVALNAPVQSYSSTAQAPLPEITSSTKQVPVVNTPATVLTQVNNSLSNIPNANVYSVDHVRAQIYRNKLVYAAPLDFDGSFWRYLRYKQVDGYFLTDATSKSADPEFVKKAMRYTPAAYFSRDAERLMYAATANSGYVLMNNAPQLEIDDSGNPYYVSTLVKRYGVTNRQDFRHKGVVSLNAVTGALHFYKDLKDKPKWLDVAVDPTTASGQIGAWGRERNGWWNANGFGGARQGVMVAVTKAGTEGDDEDVTPMLYKGQIYYQQSLTSAKSAQTSVMGYAFTDAGTGKSYYYKENADAMTPDRAQQLAKDMMKQTGWKPKMPMLYRIAGKPTWVVSMLDTSNAFRSYVYLLASGNGTQNTVATGSDAETTLAKYLALFGDSSATTASGGKKEKVQGTVFRTSIADDTLYLMLNDKKVVYTVNIKTYPFARFIQPGDTVSFTARVSGTEGLVTTKVADDKLPK